MSHLLQGLDLSVDGLSKIAAAYDSEEEAVELFVSPIVLRRKDGHWVNSNEVIQCDLEIGSKCHVSLHIKHVLAYITFFDAFK